jgi:uncharacterized protein (TIGR03083 family)
MGDVDRGEDGVMAAALDNAAYLGHIEEHGLGLADAAARAAWSDRVPSCPEWTVDDLVWHFTEVQDFWHWIVRERAADPSGYEGAERLTGDELLSTCRAGVDRLVAALRAADPDDAVWSWFPGGATVRWVARRQAHEAAVHRWDAEASAGTDWSVPADLAVDGIDEFFEYMTSRPDDDAAPVGGTVHLHCTDTDGEWLVADPEPGAPFTVTPEHAKGDAAVRGTASDLLLLVWRRVDLDAGGDRFQTFGDVDVAKRMLARSRLG